MKMTIVPVLDHPVPERAPPHSAHIGDAVARDDEDLLNY
jgi:hypothetical protein